MAVFVADWNAVAEIWGDRMWAVVWQSTLFAAVLIIFSVLFLRRSSPALRYWVWQILAIKLLVMPFWTYAIPRVQFVPTMSAREMAGFSEPTASPGTEPASPMPRPAAGVPTVAVAKTPADARDLQPASSPAGRITGLGWLLALWGVVVAAQCIRILWQHERLARLLRRATPVDESLAALVRETACRLGLRRAPQAVLTDTDCSPFVCGIRRATLVLPRRLTASLSTTELTVVLLHELAHLQRRDLVWGWIGQIVRVVYFFHPVVHWISYRLRLERELACDKIAMSFSGQNPGDYAATLVRVVSQTSEPSFFKAAATSAGLDGKAS